MIDPDDLLCVSNSVFADVICWIFYQLFKLESERSIQREIHHVKNLTDFERVDRLVPKIPTNQFCIRQKLARYLAAE